jgi:hypothetical protein
MKQTKQKLLSGIIILVLVAIPVAVSAQNNQNNQSERRATRDRTVFDDARAQRIERNCVQAQDKLGQIEERVATVKTARERIYSNIVSVLDKFLNRFNSTEIDTSDLQSHLSELKDQVAAADQLWQDYETSLKATVTNSCSDEPQNFHELLEDARDNQQLVNQSSIDIKTYINDVIKEDLTLLRDQLSAQLNQDTNATTEEGR